MRFFFNMDSMATGRLRAAVSRGREGAPRRPRKAEPLRAAAKGEANVVHGFDSPPARKRAMLDSPMRSSLPPKSGREADYPGARAAPPPPGGQVGGSRLTDSLVPT